MERNSNVADPIRSIINSFSGPDKRDPVYDPQPGDELAGPAVKVKVTAIQLDEGGVSKVSYMGAGREHPYMGNPTTVSYDRWLQFAGCPGIEILHLA